MTRKGGAYAALAAAAAAEKKKNSCTHCKKLFNFTEVRKKCRKCNRYVFLLIICTSLLNQTKTILLYL
jgi:hypothetical protein